MPPFWEHTDDSIRGYVPPVRKVNPVMLTQRFPNKSSQQREQMVVFQQCPDIFKLFVCGSLNQKHSQLLVLCCYFFCCFSHKQELGNGKPLSRKTALTDDFSISQDNNQRSVWVRRDEKKQCILSKHLRRFPPVCLLRKQPCNATKPCAAHVTGLCLF